MKSNDINIKKMFLEQDLRLQEIIKEREKLLSQRPYFTVPITKKRVYPSTRFVILLSLVGIPASIVLALLFGLVIVLSLTNWILFSRILFLMFLALVFYKIIKLVFRRKQTSQLR